MLSASFPNEDTVIEYWRTYYAWRITFGLLDPCFDELRAAALVESEREFLTVEQKKKLEALARLIDDERQAYLNRAA